MSAATKTRTKPVVLYDVPQLDIDKVLHKDNDGRPHPRGVFERRIVWNLLKQLEAAGYKVKEVDDGDDPEYVSDAKAAMELIFNLDDCTVYFEGPGGSKEWLVLVLGNAEDVLSDHGARRKETAWEKLLKDFDGEDYA